MAKSELYDKVAAIGEAGKKKADELIAKYRKDRETISAASIADLEKDWNTYKDNYIAEGYNSKVDSTNPWLRSWTFTPKGGGTHPPTPLTPPTPPTDGTSAIVSTANDLDALEKVIPESDKVSNAFVFNGDKYYWNDRTFKNAFNTLFTDYLTNQGEDLSLYKYNLKDAFGNQVLTTKVDITQHPQYQQALSEAQKLYKRQTDKPLGWMYTKYKQGGTMNKVKYFQQGGAPTQTTLNLMSPEQELKAAAQFLQAVKAGDQKAVASLKQIQQAAQQGVPEAQRMMALLEQANKMLQSAKWGSKLSYIKSLKFAKGGKTCTACMDEGGKTPKTQQPKKKEHVNPNDTVHVNGKAYSLTNSDGSRVNKNYPAYSNAQYQKDKKTKDGLKRREKADLVTSEKCGGQAKVKKHYFGGWL